MQRDDASKRLMDISQAASQLGMGERIVRRWINEGYLGSHRIGRRHFVSEAQLMALLRESER